MLGCDGPPVADGVSTEWRFPPGAAARVVLDRCPRKFMAPDACAVLRAANLADGRVSLTEQDEFPAPYLEAISLAMFEQAEAREHKRRRGPKKG